MSASKFLYSNYLLNIFGKLRVATEQCWVPWIFGLTEVGLRWLISEPVSDLRAEWSGEQSTTSAARKGGAKQAQYAIHRDIRPSRGISWARKAETRRGTIGPDTQGSSHASRRAALSGRSDVSTGTLPGIDQAFIGRALGGAGLRGSSQ